jgi:phospholipase/carboxylesterase
MSGDPHAHTSLLHAGAPLSEASLAVVLLHGRGGSAEDILGLASAFDMPDVAYLAPQAAEHTWYPLSFLSPREANQPFLRSALARVEAVVRSTEQAGMDSRGVVIGGFSQGACLATEFVASHPAPYGGLLAFTGGLIGPPGSVQRASADSCNRLDGMPAFLGCGDPDPHVPWSRVVESADVLRALGANVTTERYPGRPHTIVADELAHARSVLASAKARRSM